MFCNRPYLLIYGMFLSEFYVKVEILYYKQPSCAYDVTFKSDIKKVYDTKISEKQNEDTKAKQMIVNVAVGMLGKGTNKCQRSLDFDSLSEAVYYQNLWGGSINKVSGFYDDKELVEMTNEYIQELEEKAGKKVSEWDAYDDESGQYNFDGYDFGQPPWYRAFFSCRSSSEIKNFII